jgi:hypothetical protein
MIKLVTDEDEDIVLHRPCGPAERTAQQCRPGPSRVVTGTSAERADPWADPASSFAHVLQDPAQGQQAGGRQGRRSARPATARQLQAVRRLRDGGRGSRPRAVLLPCRGTVRRGIQAARPLAQWRYVLDFGPWACFHQFSRGVICVRV